MPRAASGLVQPRRADAAGCRLDLGGAHHPHRTDRITSTASLAGGGSRCTADAHSGRGRGGGGGGGGGSTPPPVPPSAARLSAAEALELSLLAQRYLLEGLCAPAHALLAATLTAAEVVPLLLRAQEECALAAQDAIFGWAVEHYEAVHAVIEAWLACAPLARPPVAQLLGDEALLALSANLRTEMLRVRHNL